MKRYKYVITAALFVAAIIPTTTTAKDVVAEKVYMFGFAASFNDTIVHFTEIQPLDSAWTDGKTGFLLGHNLYSGALRNYLSQTGMPHRTCVVVSDKKLSRLQKRYAKMKKLYESNKKQKNRNDIRTIAAADFQFKPLDKSMFVSEEEEAAKVQKPKKEKKSKKENRGE